MGSGGTFVSVVIPTLNAGARFAETLRAIGAQEGVGDVELCVVDSGSTDGTVERARAHGARVLTVAPEAFGHGRTRNLAIGACGGRYVALTVQDAIPADGRWLAALVEALEANPRAAGAYSRHLPHAGAGVVARQAAEYWHERLGGPHEQALGDPEAFRRLPVQEKQYRCTFNNVSSMVRRAVWEAVPFPEVPYAEDLAWGYAVLRAGHTLLYTPESMVYHSHERPPGYALRRAYVEARTVGEIFGEPARPLRPRQAEDLLALYAAPAARAAATGDRRERYRALFGGRAHGAHVAYLLGERSPFPVEERRRLFMQIVRRYAKRPAPSGQPLLDRLRQGLPHPRDYLRSLTWRLGAAVRSGRSHWLGRAEVEALFEFLWDDLGHDYVRLAVLYGGGDGADEVALAALQVEELVVEWTAHAGEAPAEDPVCQADLVCQAAALVVGRRLGEAARGRRAVPWQGRVEAMWTGGI